MRFKCLAWRHIYFSLFETPIVTCTLISLRPKHVMRERLFRGCRWVHSTELDIVNESFSNLCTLALGMALQMFATQGWRVPVMHLAVNSSSAHSPRAKLRALEKFFWKKKGKFPRVGTHKLSKCLGCGEKRRQRPRPRDRRLPTPLQFF